MASVKDKERELENEYLQRALRRSAFLRRNQSIKANKEYDRLYELKNEMRRLHDKGKAALMRITQNEDVEVQIIAAADLLAVDETYALKILRRIAKSKAGLSSFTAEMTVKEWKKGSIRSYLK